MPGERVQMEKEVVFMLEPTANFVSLVDRGANQIPFRVVKANKKGKEMTQVKKILQSIIAPNDLSIDTIQESLGEDVQKVLKFDREAKRGGFKSYEQLPRESFKPESFELVTLDAEAGIRGVQGELADPEQKGIVARLFKREPQMEVIELDESVIKVESAEVQKSYSYELSEEVSLLSQALYGLLFQEKGEMAEKLAAVDMVLANFRSFVEEALSVTKGELIPSEKDEATGRQEQTEESEMAEMQKTEALPTEETQVEEKKVDEKKVDEKKVDGVSQENFTNKVDTLFSDLEQKLSTQFSDLSSRIEKMERQIPGTVETREPMYFGGLSTSKATKKDNVFKGVLFNGNDIE